MKLMFILLFLLLIQPKPGTSESNDTTCLTQLHASLNPTTSNPNLQNWTQPYFTTPCFNSFNSHISGITCNNNRVYRISLPNSGLSGSLSPSLSFCSDLQTLDLSDNSLAGDIPETLSALSNLAVLRLNNNRLSSVIPTSLYLCAYLNVLDLRNNLLTGPVPAQLGLLARLRILELSNNRLSGMIPESLRRFNASSFEGNVGLFGYPLGPGRKGGGGGGLSVGAIVGIGVGSGVVSLVVSFVVVCVWLKVSEHKLELAQQAKISQLMPDY